MEVFTIVRVTPERGGLETAFKADDEHDAELHQGTLVVLSASGCSRFSISRSDDIHMEQRKRLSQDAIALSVPDHIYGRAAPTRGGDDPQPGIPWTEH